MRQKRAIKVKSAMDNLRRRKNRLDEAYADFTKNSKDYKEQIYFSVEVNGFMKAWWRLQHAWSNEARMKRASKDLEPS